MHFGKAEWGAFERLTALLWALKLGSVEKPNSSSNTYLVRYTDGDLVSEEELRWLEAHQLVVWSREAFCWGLTNQGEKML